MFVLVILKLKSYRGTLSIFIFVTVLYYYIFKSLNDLLQKF